MRLSADFFIQDAEKLARELIGKVLIRTFADGHEMSLMITETEAYTGEHDWPVIPVKAVLPALIRCITGAEYCMFISFTECIRC